MELPAELITALAAFAAVVAAQLLKGAVRMIMSYVRRTPTSIDNKIWAAVSEGIFEALNAQEIVHNEVHSRGGSDGQARQATQAKTPEEVTRDGG